MKFSNKTFGLPQSATRLLSLTWLLVFATAQCPPPGSDTVAGNWDDAGGTWRTPECSSTGFLGAIMCVDTTMRLFNPDGFTSWTGLQPVGTNCNAITWSTGEEVIGIDTWKESSIQCASGMTIYTKNAAGVTNTYDFSSSNKEIGPNYLDITKPVVGFRVATGDYVDRIQVYLRDACARMTWTTVEPSSIADIDMYINTEYEQDLSFTHDLENIWSAWGAITLSLTNPGPAVIEVDPISGVTRLAIRPNNVATDIGTWNVVLNAEVDYCEEVSNNKHISFTLTVLPECFPQPYYPAPYEKLIGYTIGSGLASHPATFVRTDCPELVMTYGIVSVPTPTTSTLFTMSGTNLQILSTDDADATVYTVTIEYYTNKVPITKSASPIVLQISVTTTANNCAASIWDDQAWEITEPTFSFKQHHSPPVFFDYLSTSGVFNFNAFTYTNPTNTDCGVPQYQLVSQKTSTTVWTLDVDGNPVGTLTEIDLVTFDPATLTLTAWTDDPTDIGLIKGNYLIVSFPDPALVGLARKIEFSVEVTSVCQDAVIVHNRTQYVHHPLNITAPATEYELTTEITDDVSKESVGGDFENERLHYCGPYVFQKQSLIWLESFPTDESVLDFNNGSPIKITANSVEQFGRYNLTFTVGLVRFPSFTPQENWLEFEIVPNCLESVISVPAGYTITFKGAPLLTWQEKKLKPDFSNSMSTFYKGYCDPIEFIVTPDMFTDSTISLDEGLLRIAPDDNVPFGDYDFVLTARLKKYPQVLLNVTFEVTVLDCVVNDFYFNDSYWNDTLKEMVVPRISRGWYLTYVIGQPYNANFVKWTGTVFNDYDLDPLRSTPGCESNFVQSFEILVDSSWTIPSWLLPQDYDERTFRIHTTNDTNCDVHNDTNPNPLLPSFCGTHYLRLQAKINTIPEKKSVTYQFHTLFIKTDFCYEATIQQLRLAEQFFTIDNNSVPTVFTFPIPNLNPPRSQCGDLFYDMWDKANNVVSRGQSEISLEQAIRKVSIYTTDGKKVGRKQHVIRTSMGEYQNINMFARNWISFWVTIDSVCTDTEIYDFSYPEVVFQLGQPPKIVKNILHKDLKSLNEGQGDGFTLCGLRNYTSNNPSLFTVPAQGNIISMTVLFPDDTPMYLYTSDGLPPRNVKYPVSINVSLADYDTIENKTFFFNLYVAQPETNCHEESVKIYLLGNQVTLQTVVNSLGLDFKVPYCTALQNDALMLNGVKDPENLKFCGKCRMDLSLELFTRPDKTKVSGTQKIPDWVKQFYDADSGLHTNLKFHPADEEDVGTYSFKMFYWLEEYPLITGQAFVNLEVLPRKAAKGNPPKVTLDEECFKQQIPVGESKTWTYILGDIDSNEKLIWKIEGLDILQSACPDCLSFLSPEKSWVQEVRLKASPDLLGMKALIIFVVTDSTKLQDNLDFEISIVEAGKENKYLCIEDAKLSVETEKEKIKSTSDQRALNNFMVKLSYYFELGNLDQPEILPNLNEFPLPIPFIREVDAQGLVKVGLTQEIMIPTISDMIPFLYQLHEDELISIFLCNFEISQCVKGEPVFNETNFREVNQNIIYPEHTNKTERLLQAGKSLKISDSETKLINEDEFSRARQRSFNWTIERYESKQINIRLNYSTPIFVSAPVWEDVKIVLNNAQEFLIVPGTFKATPNGFVIQKVHPRQTSAEVEVVLGEVGNSGRYAMQIMTIGNIFVALYMRTNLLTLWSGYNALQFTVHLPVYSLYFPQNVNFVFEKLINFVNFDFLDTLKYFGLVDPIVVTFTPPWNNNFNELGYDNSNTYQNLGLVNYILWFLTLVTLLFFVTRFACFRTSKTGAKMYGKYNGKRLFNVLTRFWLETYFVMLMTVFITLVPNKKLSQLALSTRIETAGDFFTYVYTLILCGFLGVFFIFLVLAVAILLKRKVDRNRWELDRVDTVEEEEVLEVKVPKPKKRGHTIEYNLNKAYAVYNGLLKENQSEKSSDSIEVNLNRANDVYSNMLKESIEEKSSFQDKDELEDSDRQLLSSSSSATKFAINFFVLQGQVNESELGESQLESPEQTDELEVKCLIQLFQKEDDKPLPQIETEESTLLETSLDEVPDALREERWLQFLETFTEGMSLMSYMSTIFYVIFLVRRIIFVVAAFFLVNMPVFQVLLFVLVWLFYGTFLVSVQIFEKPFDYGLEVMNEIFVYLAGLHLVVLYLHREDTEVCVNVGWSLIGCVLLNLGINLLVAFKYMVGALKLGLLWFKNMFVQSKAAFNSKKVAFDHRAECLCNCAHCGKNADVEKLLEFDPQLYFSIRLQKCDQESAFGLDQHLKSDVGVIHEEKHDLESITNKVFTKPEGGKTTQGIKQTRLIEEQTLESATKTVRRVRLFRNVHK